jgi:glycosyltransferase involved in cell wall biosynthesis
MSKTFLVCGHFGTDDLVGGGQAVKTRLFAEMIQERYPDARILRLDTTRWLTQALIVIFRLRRAYRQADRIFVLPGYRGIKAIIPLLSFWNRSRQKDIRYIVIGGWLPERLAQSRFLASHVARLNGIYVETKAMKRKLEEQGFDNIRYFPNFKKFSFRPAPRTPQLPLRILFLSRIMPTKGVELAIEGIKRVNAKAGEVVCSLDICGPHDDDYREEFESLKAALPGFIKHVGFIEQDRFYETIAAYDLLVFPTYYQGEGFPGVIIDAFICGVPVLASLWKYNSELVRDEQTGLLFAAKNLDDFVSKLDRLLGDLDLLSRMKRNCLLEAQKYHADEVMQTLVDELSEYDRVHG